MLLLFSISDEWGSVLEVLISPNLYISCLEFESVYPDGKGIELYSLWLGNLTFFRLCHDQCIITVGNLQNSDAFFYMLFPNVLDQLLRAMPSNRLEDLFVDHKSPNVLSLFVLIKNGEIKASYRGLLLMFSLLSMGCGSHCIRIRRPWHSRQALITDKPMSLIFTAMKVIVCLNAWILKFLIVYVCMCAFFVIFPVKIALTLISMLMYSCLHLTLEYVMANYHYTGWKIRALSEVLGFRNKGRPIQHPGSRPNNCNPASWNWWGLCVYFFFSFFSLTFWKEVGEGG